MTMLKEIKSELRSLKKTRAKVFTCPRRRAKKGLHAARQALIAASAGLDRRIAILQGRLA